MSYPSQWTPGVKSAFLTALAETGEVIAACECINLSSQGAYRHRALDPAFARAWDVARHQAREIVLDRLTSRALDGWQEDVFYKGEIVGTRQRHDNRLILALIGRLDRLVDGKQQARQAARAAPRFAGMLDDIAADRPVDQHFIATREDREAIMIDRARQRGDYAFYVDRLTSEERDWVDGIVWVDDDDDDGEEEDEEMEGKEANGLDVAPATPAPAKAGEPGPLSPQSDIDGEHHPDSGPGSSPGRRDVENVTPAPEPGPLSSRNDSPPQPDFPHPRVHHSSSLLDQDDSPEATAKAALESATADDAALDNDPEWQAIEAKWAMIEKAMHGERSVWRQERGGPKFRML